jgi:hypothetical protein
MTSQLFYEKGVRFAQIEELFYLFRRNVAPLIAEGANFPASGQTVNLTSSPKALAWVAPLG